MCGNAGKWWRDDAGVLALAGRAARRAQLAVLSSALFQFATELWRRLHDLAKRCATSAPDIRDSFAARRGQLLVGVALGQLAAELRVQHVASAQFPVLESEKGCAVAISGSCLQRDLLCWKVREDVL